MNFLSLIRAIIALLLSLVTAAVLLIVISFDLSHLTEPIRVIQACYYQFQAWVHSHVVLKEWAMPGLALFIGIRHFKDACRSIRKNGNMVLSFLKEAVKEVSDWLHKR